MLTNTAPLWCRFQVGDLSTLFLAAARIVRSVSMKTMQCRRHSSRRLLRRKLSVSAETAALDKRAGSISWDLVVDLDISLSVAWVRFCCNVMRCRPGYTVGMAEPLMRAAQVNAADNKVTVLPGAAAPEGAGRWTSRGNVIKTIPLGLISLKFSGLKFRSITLADQVRGDHQRTCIILKWASRPLCIVLDMDATQFKPAKYPCARSTREAHIRMQFIHRTRARFLPRGWRSRKTMTPQLSGFGQPRRRRFCNTERK